MASLLESNGGSGGDLFGNDDPPEKDALFPPTSNEHDHEPPPFATHTPTGMPGTPLPLSSNGSSDIKSTASVEAPVPVVTAPDPAAAAPAPAASLLMQSGLLPGASSGGLFDEVDQQEEDQAKAQAAAEEKNRREEEEAARQAQQAAKEDLQRQQQEALKQQQQEQQTQQLTDQMQSVYLGNSTMPPSQMQPPPPQQTQQPYGHMAQSMPPPSPHGFQGAPGYGAGGGMMGGGSNGAMQHSTGGPLQAGFYRDHGMPPGGPQAVSPSIQAPYQQKAPEQRYYQPTQSPSALAGMHNGPVPQQAVLGRPPTALLGRTEPPAVPTYYAHCKVSEPLLIPGQALFGAAPHWSYQIATTLRDADGRPNTNGVWFVRRRFRHVVALEDRLREECPGAILPPR
jgi:hypothetical protein